MSELNSMEVDTTETIQDIAIKLVTEQLRNESRLATTPTERTLFVLGSKGVVSEVCTVCTLYMMDIFTTFSMLLSGQIDIN